MKSMKTYTVMLPTGCLKKGPKNIRLFVSSNMKATKTVVIWLEKGILRFVLNKDQILLKKWLTRHFIKQYGILNSGSI